MKTNFNNKKNLVRYINTQNNTPFGIADSLKLRNSNSQILNEKIENLKINNLNNLALNSKANEISQITNNKSVTSYQKNNQTNGLSLNTSDISSLLLGYSASIFKKGCKLNSSTKYVPLGNRNIALSLLSTNLTINSDQKKIRHYLNLLTNYEFKLFNSNFNFYNFKNTNKYLFAMEKASQLLKLAFYSKGCLISKPSFNIVYTNRKIENEINPNLDPILSSKTPKIIINLFYYIKKATILSSKNSSNGISQSLISDTFNNKFDYLTDHLTKLFGTEVELNLTRLYQPYQDSNILVQHLNSRSYNNKFIKLVSTLFKNINIYKQNKTNLSLTQSSQASSPAKTNTVSYPSGISGVNIKLAGRALNERIIPRLTVKRAQRGSFNRLNAKLIEKSIYTDKTRKGAFSFTVTLSQVFR